MPVGRGRVFFVSAGEFVGGTPRTWTFVDTQARSLVDLGWDVRLSVVDDRTSPWGVARNVGRLRREIAASGAEVVHAQYGSVTAAAAGAARRSRPLVVTFCGQDLLGTPVPGLVWRVRGPAGRAIGLAAVSRAQAVIVVSPNLLAALPRRLQRRTALVPHGVDDTVFVPGDRAAARAALRWPDAAPVVLFYAGMGRHRRAKNLPLATATVDAVRRTDPDVRLHVVTGMPQATVAQMMNAADCLLVTSLIEGSPNIVREAMACNLPVVSVPCGDVGDRLRHVEPGGVAPYDAAALARAVRGVLDTHARSNGRAELIRQGLTATTVAPRIDAIYEAVRSGERPACAG
jgi:glycosyltransferase involved in cell wall biosynthesis